MKNKKVEGLLLSRITVKHGTEGWGPDARTLVDGDGGPWARPGRPIMCAGARGFKWETSLLTRRGRNDWLAV